MEGGWVTTCAPAPLVRYISRTYARPQKLVLGPVPTPQIIHRPPLPISPALLHQFSKPLLHLCLISSCCPPSLNKSATAVSQNSSTASPATSRPSIWLRPC